MLPKPLEYVRPTYRTTYKFPLVSSVLHLGQPQPQPFNPLIPNELRRRRAVRPLKIKIPSKKLGRQRCTDGFNFVAKRLIRNSLSSIARNEHIGPSTQCSAINYVFKLW